MICNACPRKCNVDRQNTLGYCKSPDKFKLARAALHFWEEPCISGKNGSGAIFFSGCNLGCVFCQNFDISHNCKGVEVSDDKLIDIMKSLVDKGANNINLFNPTHYSAQLLRVFEKYKPPVPIVYNTSGYDSVETLRLFDGIVDVYLPDFKYIRPDKAQKYSKAENYPQVAEAALSEMKRQVKSDVFDDRGIMQKGMIIRHLVLPSNTNASVEALDYLAKNFDDTYISVMAQYVPCGDLSDYKEINRPLTKREYDKVVNHIFDLGLDKIFVQELEAASDEFIPDFDFTGVVDFD